MEGTILCEEHAVLRFVCLQSSEERAVTHGEGLLFIFPIVGAGQWWTGAWTQGLLPGEVLIVNPATRGKLRASPAQQLVFSCFFLGTEQLAMLCAPHQLYLLQGIVDRFRQPRSYPAARSLARTCHELLQSVPPVDTLEHRSHLLRVVALLLSDEFREPPPVYSGLLGSDEHFLQVLARSSIADLTLCPVQELAARFGCSRRQLNRLLHKHFGKSACALRQEMRLLRAAVLLRNPASKVINVAEQCGFNHLGLFNTYFKRRFGVCPSVWRQNGPAQPANARSSLRGHPNCQVRAQGLCAWSEPPSLTTTAKHQA